MGSASDRPTFREAVDVLKKFRVPYEMEIVSAHRTPRLLYEYARKLSGRGVQVVIAGAGGAAHLPGMVASLTTVPVIGVPVPLKNLEGLDSLLSIAQMPAGVPVATVAIGNSHNAALLAVQILAFGGEGKTLASQKLRTQLEDYKDELVLKVLRQRRKK